MAKKQKSKWMTRTWTKEEKTNCEYWFIRFFVINAMYPCSGNRLLMSEVFDAYKKYKWKQRNEREGLGDISIDTFGRLFPKDIYKRRLLRKAGHFGTCVVDAAINEEALTNPYTQDGRVEE